MTNRGYEPKFTVSGRAMQMMMDIAAFIEFMLDKILRTLKAKGEAYESNQKSDQKIPDSSHRTG